jgi:hypothetical protein
MAGIGLSSNMAAETGGNANLLFGQGSGIQQTLTPFFQNELYNPQGFGAKTLSSMLTADSEATAGGMGAARQSAQDMAARTGNLAAIPSIERSANATGINTLTDLTNRLGMENTMEKMSQQQQGAAGLSSIMGADYGASTGMYQQENDAIKNLISASNSTFGHELGAGIAGAIPAAAGGFGGMLGKYLSQSQPSS